MGRQALVAGALALSGAAAIVVAGCGGSSTSGSATTNGGAGAGSTGGTGSTGATGGSITVLFGTAPDSLDPQFSYTTQGAEPDWITYTPLLTYAHASGEAGTKLIPGLAESLPTVSADGRTYTLKLRKGLTFSNGKPVKASDFAYTIERAIKMPWGGKSFFTNYVKGASAYDTGKAKTISGITTDDATGTIRISLSTPYGAFPNVIAFPAAGLVPSGTPMRNLANNPPPGVGPYMITKVTPNQGFTLQRNPRFAAFKIPGIPTGSLDTINAKIQSNTLTGAQQVLDNRADVFDAGDTLPPSLVQRVQSEAKDRFSKETIPSTFYFFLNTKLPPFNNEKARVAVNYALDRNAMVRLASGFLEPACFFIPDGLAGHPSGSCPYRSPDLAKAKQMVKDAGLAGTPVTVWGQQRSPRREFVEYYADVLNKIGFKATPKIIADATYFTTIGNVATKAQTGFADWLQDFPNPSDFYFLLYGPSIQPTNNQNFGQVRDPQIDREYARLAKVPATKLDSVASDWSKLDEYQAKKAYTLVYGSEQLPKFFSNRIDFGSAVFHPLYLNDWSTIRVKGG